MPGIFHTLAGFFQTFAGFFHATPGIIHAFAGFFHRPHTHSFTLDPGIFHRLFTCLSTHSFTLREGMDRAESQDSRQGIPPLCSGGPLFLSCFRLSMCFSTFLSSVVLVAVRSLFSTFSSPLRVDDRLALLDSPSLVRQIFRSLRTFTAKAICANFCSLSGFSKHHWHSSLTASCCCCFRAGLQLLYYCPLRAPYQPYTSITLSPC